MPVAHGKAVHTALREIYTDRKGGDLDLTKLEAVCRGAVRNTWYPRNIDLEQQMQRVMAAVRGFVQADDYEDINGILGLEVQGEFEVRVRDSDTGEPRVLCILSSRLDCVLSRVSEPETLVIRERKTTSQRVDLKECYIMMRVARKLYPSYRQITIEFDWLDPEENRVVRDTVTQQEVAGQHQIVMGLAYKVLTATEYPAVPGEQVCKFCPHRSSCQSLPADEIRESTLRQMAEGLPIGT